MRRSLLAASVAALVALAGCGGGSGEHQPSPDQAQVLLADFFELAQTKDEAVFCADERVYSADSCRNHWEWAGGADSVPSESPRVLGAREDTDLLALRVCGVDGLGRPYQGDFVVEWMGDRLRVPLPVFWEGVNYSGTYDEDEVPLAGAGRGPTGRVGCP